VTSPAHGFVTTDGTNITYTATNNYSGGDSFIYTVSDPQGAGASALVTVNVAGGGSAYNVILTMVAGSNVILTYAGIPENPYVLEQTYDLTPPVQWQPLVTNMTGMNGLLMFTNIPDPATNKFWRVYAP
jgi:Bacterial Ig domain